MADAKCRRVGVTEFYLAYLHRDHRESRHGFSSAEICEKESADATRIGCRTRLGMRAPLLSFGIFGRRGTMASSTPSGASPRILFVAAVKSSLCGVGGSPLKTVPALMISERRTFSVPLTAGPGN
ncbi:uncharacterized protein LOC119300895 [Triticum dicoccoides]|uniref:uncharacterized protein LOC119300895 n=1 Tax=Triticum dicoccoides TaxID=85692 RepID=UPI00188EDFC3|nr:uncharacterized protein LOC119300895 [Triticum dicoccoides]